VLEPTCQKSNKYFLNWTLQEYVFYKCRCPIWVSDTDIPFKRSVWSSSYESQDLFFTNLLFFMFFLLKVIFYIWIKSRFETHQIHVYGFSRRFETNQIYTYRVILKNSTLYKRSQKEIDFFFLKRNHLFEMFFFWKINTINY